MDIKKLLRPISNILLVAGGIAWGLKVFNFELVPTLLGLANLQGFANVVYGAVGISALYIGYEEFIARRR